MRTLHHYTPTTIPCKDERGFIKERPGEKRRFEVKLCTRCNKVFENYHAGSRGEKISYYKGFPRYGLKKGICLICQRK